MEKESWILKQELNRLEETLKSLRHDLELVKNLPTINCWQVLRKNIEKIEERIRLITMVLKF